MRPLTSVKITFVSGELIVKKSERFQLYLETGKIIELNDCFAWSWGEEPIPFGDDGGRVPYEHGYTTNLDDAMRNLVRAAGTCPEFE